MANAVDKLGWKLMGGATAGAAATFARKTAAKAYQFSVGEAPPDQISSPAVPLKQAMGWAVFSGVTAGLAKLLVERTAAAAWLRARGELPPGFEPKKDKKGKKDTTDKVSAKKSDAGKV